MRRRRNHPICRKLIVIGFTKIRNQCIPVEFSVKLVNFGNFLFEFFAISLRKTAHHEKFSKLILLFGFGKRQNSADGLLFGIADETTGVDYGNFATRLPRIVFDGVTIGNELSHQSFGIDKIFGTSQCNDVYFVFYHEFEISFSLSKKLLLTKKRIDKIFATKYL